MRSIQPLQQTATANLVLESSLSLSAAAAAELIVRGQEARRVELPDQMPEACNFYGLLQTALTPAAIARRFTTAGWKFVGSSGQVQLEVGWGRLLLLAGNPVVAQGWLDRPDDHVGELLGLLGSREINGVYQWINAEGRPWRELPFDESTLDPDDPRLPSDIMASILASRGGPKPAAQRPKPWWQFW
jgi:hypothetical protein